MSNIEAVTQRVKIDVTGSTMDCSSPLGESALSEHEAGDLAHVFAALGDPIRLRMLSLIASEDEVCSCALELPLEKSQPTISHHTRILARAGLISGEKRGRWMWWHVVPERLNATARILAFQEGSADSSDAGTPKAGESVLAG